MSTGIDIRRLEASDLGLIGAIDRSEHVSVEYVVIDGRLTTNPVDWQIPTFDPVGVGQHSVHEQGEHWRPVVNGGALLLGAFSLDQLLGLAIVDPVFEPGLAWFAFLQVSAPFRRKGVGTALWSTAVEYAVAAEAGSMYVSAAPSGSAVGFYLGKGCALTPNPHADLFEAEPDDIHLTCPIAR